MNVLVVEDEVRLANSIKDILEVNDYHVDVVHDGKDGIYYGVHGHYDVMILDIMLPEKNGFEVLEALRLKNIKIPIILLSAKSELDDRVNGLDKGADDYLTKPFHPDELLARIRALLRRPPTILTHIVGVEDLSLNMNNQMLKCKNKEIQLSHKETQVLHLMMMNNQEIVSKQKMIIKVWGYDAEVEDNSVEAHISFLRRKLEFLQSKVSIVTLRKVGYGLKVLDD